jgi:ATP-dependent RNA helicase RhlE
MLDLGFLPDVKRILAAVPKRRQTLLFSATMPAPIEQLAQRILHKPAKVYVTPVASTTELVEQRVHFVSRDRKPDTLAQILRDPAVRRVLVFTRTKRGCDRVARRLAQDGVPAQAIHGNKSQTNREKSMGGFRAGKIRVLVATDIAARGIDVDDITHVVNYEIPNVPETYVHRIGRTARAGAAGVAISLCAPEEREYVRDIERLIRRSIAVVGEPPAAVNGKQAENRPTRHESRPAGKGGRQRSGSWAARDVGRGAGRGGSRSAGGGRPSLTSRGGRGPARVPVQVARQESEQKLDTFGMGI